MQRPNKTKFSKKGKVIFKVSSRHLTWASKASMDLERNLTKIV
jgi:hypothetical protein